MTMIPNAMKMCENDPITHCGCNVFWDRNMTAVKSGKFEKHRKVPLVKKKIKKEKNPYLCKIPYSSRMHSWEPARGWILTVRSGFDHKLGLGLHSHALCPELL